MRVFPFDRKDRIAKKLMIWSWLEIVYLELKNNRNLEMYAKDNFWYYLTKR